MEDVLLGPLADAVGSKGLLDMRTQRSRELDAHTALLFELKSPLFRRDRVEAKQDENPEPWLRSIVRGNADDEGALHQLRKHVDQLRVGKLTVAGRPLPSTHEVVPVVAVAIPVHPRVIQVWMDDLCSDRQVWPWPDVRPLCLPLQELEALTALVGRDVDVFKVLKRLGAPSNTQSLQSLAEARNLPLSPRAFRAAGEAAFDSALKQLEGCFS